MVSGHDNCFRIKAIARKMSLEHSIRFAANFRVVRLRTALLTDLFHSDLRSPVSIFIVFLSEAIVRSSIPIFCACIVLAWSMLIPRTSATSSITWDTKADLLPELIVVGKYWWLAMVLIMTLATVFESYSTEWYANRYLENTSMVVTMFSTPPEGGSSGTKPFCMAFPVSVICSIVFCMVWVGESVFVAWPFDALFIRFDPLSGQLCHAQFVKILSKGDYDFSNSRMSTNFLV